MVRKQLYLEAHQNELLKAAAERTGKTESELIRDAIDAAYDPDAVRRDREEAAAEWRRKTDELAEVISRTGGIRHMTRDEMYEDRIRKARGQK
jgi:hypothetical protein